MSYAEYVVLPLRENGAMNNNSRATRIFGLGVMKLVETEKRKKKRRSGEFRSTRLLLKITLLLGVFAGGGGVILPGKLFEDYGELS